MSSQTLDPRALGRADVRGTYEITIGEDTHTVRVARLGDADCGDGHRYGVQLVLCGHDEIFECSRTVAGDGASVMAASGWACPLRKANCSDDGRIRTWLPSAP